MEQGPTERPNGPNPTSSTLGALANQSLPLEIDALEIGADGSVKARDPNAPFCFRFHYQGVPFDVKLEGGKSGNITVSSDLGELPFTAESPQGRRDAQRIVRHAGNLCHGRLFLDKRDHICLEGQTPRPSPATRTAVFAAIAAIILEFLPYLRLLIEVLPGRSYNVSMQ